MNQINLLLISLLLLGFSSCKLDSPEIEFNKQQWFDRIDMSYPYRERMLNDLLDNHQLKGLSYAQVIELLGSSELSDNKVWYEIVTDYGSDIDPVYVKNLVIQFTPDSIVTGYKIQEWSKE